MDVGVGVEGVEGVEGVGVGGDVPDALSLSLLGGMDTPQSAPAAGLGPVPLLPSGPGPGLAVFMATLVPVPAGQTGACQRTD